MIRRQGSLAAERVSAQGVLNNHFRYVCNELNYISFSILYNKENETYLV